MPIDNHPKITGNSQIRRTRKLWADLFNILNDLIGYTKVRVRFADQPVMSAFFDSFQSLLQPRKTILFYPDRPNPSSVAYKLCALLEYRISSNPARKFTAAFKRKNRTYFDPALLKSVPLAPDRILNSKSTDISKKMVGKIFGEVFGYDLDVDPRSYSGKIVEKSNLNAVHRGKVLPGPLSEDAIKPEFVYQKAIENLDGKGKVVDLRVPVHGDAIPLVYIKYRPLEDRFSNKNDFVEIRETDDVFSSAEQRLLLQFAARVGIDYGEFDVLRDRDRRIYVVDVNNTPWGPPNGLPMPEQKKALRTFLKTFDKLIENNTISS